MLLSEPLASLITFFRTSLIKFYYNSQRLSDSFYHIETRKFAMAILHRKQDLLCDKQKAYQQQRCVNSAQPALTAKADLNRYLLQVHKIHFHGAPLGWLSGERVGLMT